MAVLNRTGRVPAEAKGNRHGVRRVGGYRAVPAPSNPTDFFPTPEGCTKAIIAELEDVLPDGLWCEPAVGDGAIVRAVGVRAGWVTMDIQDVPQLSGSNVHFPSTDFLTFDPDGATFDVTITNPPFYLAEEFVRKAISCSTHVVMLLRLAFLETRRREAFHAEHPSDVYILSRRPSFMENGATDSCAYAWFHWWPGATRKWKILVTPATKRPRRG